MLLLDNVLAMLVDMDLIVQVSLDISALLLRKLPQPILFPEFDCPVDGTCSDQGSCDDSTGTCVCNEGFEGATCEGM